MSMIENDPAILGLKSRCATLETNGNQLEERIKGLQTDLHPIRNFLFGYAKIDLIQNVYEKVG